MFSQTKRKEDINSSPETIAQNTANDSPSSLTELCVTHAKIGAMGKGKTIFQDEDNKENNKEDIKKKIIGLLTYLSNQSGWVYHKGTEKFPPRFRLNGEKTNIITIYNNVSIIAEATALAMANKHSRKIKRERFTVQEFIFERGVRKIKGKEIDANKDHIIDIHSTTNQFQALYDTLLPLKNKKIHCEESAQEHSSADSKSELKETNHDISLRIWWHGINAQGNNCQFTAEWLENSKDFLNKIQGKLCEEFTPSTSSDIIIFVPAQLIRKKIKSKASKIEEYRKMREQDKNFKKLVSINIGASPKPDSLKKEIQIPCYKRSTNQFFDEMIQELNKITHPVKHFFQMLNWLSMDDNALAIQFIHTETGHHKVKQTLEENGLTFYDHGIDELSEKYVAGVNLYEVYIKKLYSPVENNKHSDQKKAIANSSSMPAVNAMVRAGSHPIFTQSTQSSGQIISNDTTNNTRSILP